MAERVGRKAALYGASMADTVVSANGGDEAEGPLCLVTPEVVMRLWTEAVMPLTKRVQVRCSIPLVGLCSIPVPLSADDAIIASVCPIFEPHEYETLHRGSQPYNRVDK